MKPVSLTLVSRIAAALRAPAPDPLQDLLTKEELARAKAKSFAYTPNPGFEPNPLRPYRNLPCPCGSKRKIKRCHGATDYLTTELAAHAREYLRKLSAAGFIEARRSEIR
mgnify:CR=1 FL=1